jgi:hypothetical protein
MSGVTEEGWALGIAEGAEASSEDLLHACHVLEKAGHIAKARTVLERLLQGMDFREDIRIGIAMAAVDSAEGNVDRALATVEGLIHRNPENLHPYRMKFEILVQHRRYQEAIDCLQILPPCPSDPAMTAHLVYRALALGIYMNTEKLHRPFIRPTITDSAPEAAVVMMLKDEDDVILQNLVHHHRLGIRKFVLLNNGSVDSTAGHIAYFAQRHRDALVCEINDPTVAYFQAGKTQAAVDFAISYLHGVKQDIRWCFVLDADEFIDMPEAMGGIAALLQAADSTGKDFIAFHLCNGISDPLGDFDPDSTDLYTHFNRIAVNPPRFVMKNAFRCDIGAKIAMGNHSIDYPGLSASKGFMAAASGVRLVHLPFRSEEQTIKKIINGGLALQAANFDQAIGLHWRRMYDRLKSDHTAGAREQMLNFYHSILGDISYAGPFQS